jgi:hypothetical protein
VGERRRCDQCGSPLDGDQRYCLNCGARAGDQSLQLRELLHRVPGSGEQASPGAQAGVPAEGVQEGLRLPGPRISALLVAVFVGFGALIGSAAGRPSPARRVRLVSPPGAQASASASTGAGASSGETSAGAGGESTQPETAGAETETTPPSGAPSSSEGSGKAGSGGSATQQPSGKSEHSGSKAPPPRKLNSIKHVFVVVLADEPYAADFGPESSARYISHTLESKGELLLRYDAIAHEQLPNGIALLSGQGPTAQTAANCPVFSPLTPATPGPDEQVLGSGCVYPASVLTLPGQLEAKHLGWRAYIEGLGEGPATAGPCTHPAPGASDPTLAGGAYATFRNPIVYFESITSKPSCQTAEVGLSQLKSDLAGSGTKAPAFSYIVPDRCHDGGPTPCSPGAPAGPAAASAWLETVAPSILASKAFKKNGLLVITTDEAPSSGEFADSSACCGQPSYPNYTAPELDHGGGGVGALLISPFIKGGTTSQDPYNHFSLLRTVEDVFGLGHLGYAGLPAVKSFSTALLNAPAGKGG